MQKYNIVSDWLNATVSIQTRNTLQAFVDGAARDQEQDVQPGDIVRWRMTSNGRVAFAVFRPEQAELPKARSKAPVAPPVASPVELPAGITPEVLAQALAIAASMATKAPAKGKAKRKA